MEPGGSEEQMNCSGDVLIQDWDIGKLIHSNVKLNDLSRKKVYGILTCEPPMATSAYPRTHQSESESFRQFQPSNFHGYTTASLKMVLFVGHVQFLLPVQLGDRLLGNL